MNDQPDHHTFITNSTGLYELMESTFELPDDGTLDIQMGYVLQRNGLSVDDQIAQLPDVLAKSREEKIRMLLVSFGLEEITDSGFNEEI
jgi:ABC-type proline/glycine betaine transport system ATPase subunit